MQKEIQEQKLYSLKETSEILCVSVQTLRNWDCEKKFIAIRTEGGHRRYVGKDIKERLTNAKK